MGLFHKTIDVSVEDNMFSVHIVLRINGVIASRITCVSSEGNSLLIGDISPYKKRKYYNKGYGSMMLNKLFEYAKNNGIATICGNLSIVDLDHKNRLHHFYEKHGFEIILHEEPHDMYYGQIQKML